MMCRTFRNLIVALLLPLGSAHALNWDEGLLGDLSGDGNAPTLVTLSSGSNLFTGTMGSLNGTGRWMLTSGPSILPQVIT